MRTDKLQEFDEDEAKNLLLNFRIMMDIKKYKVPDSSSMWKEDITLNEWLRRFSKRIFYEINPVIGKEFLRILNTIDSQNKLIADRVEEMYRRIMLVAERKDAYIEDLQARIKELEELVDAQKQMLNQSSKNNSVDAEDVPKSEEEKKVGDKKERARLRKAAIDLQYQMVAPKSSSPLDIIEEDEDENID